MTCPSKVWPDAGMWRGPDATSPRAIELLDDIDLPVASCLALIVLESGGFRRL